MKTNKKSFRKAALPVFGVLAAAVMSLTSVTYAWFTSGNEATVATINVGVESAGGLQIAMGNGSNKFQWSSNVEPNISDVKLSPVSTDGQLNEGKLVFYTATYNDTLDKIHSINTVTEASKAYVTFDLYFRNPEGSDKEIQIDGTEIKSTSGYSHQAARLAFVTQGTISSLASNQSAEAFTSYSAASHASIYEPNAYVHTIDGMEDVALTKNAKISETINTVVTEDNGDYYNYRAITKVSNSATIYHDRYTGETYNVVDRNVGTFPVEGTTYYIMGNVVSEWSVDSDYNEMTNQQVYDYVMNDKNPDIEFYNKTSAGVYEKVTVYSGTGSERVIDDAELQKYAKLYTRTPLTVYTKAAGDVLVPVETMKDEKATFITLKSQTVTKVTVYIWIEGQDADCTNTVAGYDFDVSLKFSVK